MFFFNQNITIGNNKDNVQEIEKDELNSNTEVGGDFFRLLLVFFIAGFIIPISLAVAVLRKSFI